MYTDHVIQLLKSECPTEFEERYTELSNIWSKEFDSYFLGQKDDLKMFAARYKIELWKIYNPNSVSQTMLLRVLML